MSYYKPDHVYDASLALNVPDDLWETPDTLNCLGVNETMFFTQANIDAFVQQQDVVMENGCFEFEACPEPSKVPMGTELYSGGCDYQSNGNRYPSPIGIFPAKAKELAAKSNCLRHLQVVRTAPRRLRLPCVRIKSYLSL